MTSAPRPCIKPTNIRNPWVCDDPCESSNSSSLHSHPTSHQSHQSHELKNRNSHGVLAAQYATPFQGHSSVHSQSTSGHSVHSMPTESETQPMVSPSSGGHSGHGSGVIQGMMQGGPNAHAVILQQTVNGTQSVYSMAGPHLQAPHPAWQDNKNPAMWPPPSDPLSGVPGPPGVYTLAGDGRTATLGHNTQPPGPGGTGSAVGWCGHPVVDSGRCYQFNVFCFRCAQVVFVLGIIGGFTLLVAGGVYQKHQFPHLQVLVYIGAMVALVSIVLLVIFCAVNRRPSYKRTNVPRSNTHHSGLESENMPLRPVPDPGGLIDSSLCPTVGGNQTNVINDYVQCSVRSIPPSGCSTNPSIYSGGSKSVQFNLAQPNQGMVPPGRNDCMMMVGGVMAGVGYSVQPSGEMFLVNPSGHHIVNPMNPSGHHIVNPMNPPGHHLPSQVSHSGCLVNPHGHVMAGPNPAVQSSHKIHQQGNRCEARNSGHFTAQYMDYHQSLWKKLDDEINDQSSKL